LARGGNKSAGRGLVWGRIGFAVTNGFLDRTLQTGASGLIHGITVLS